MTDVRRGRRIGRVASGAVVAVGLAGCQLIGGIGDIELGPADAATADVRRADAANPVDASHDASFVDARTAREAGPPDAVASQDSAPPPPDTGSEPDAGLTVCVNQGVCYASGNSVGSVQGDESEGFCAGGLITACGAIDAACCKGNPNGMIKAGATCESASSAPAVCDEGGHCAACGAQHQACCLLSTPNGPSNAACMGSGAVCAGGTCVPCGDVGEPCCVKGPACASTTSACSPEGICTACSCAMGVGLCCTGTGSCVPLGQSCGNGSICGSDGTCSTGTATQCGISGQVCCMGTSPCRDGSVCLDGACERCGALDQPCCVEPDGSRSCASRNVCNASGSGCMACGGAGQPCCAGAACAAGTCDANNLCDIDAGCGGCGGVGQPCCPDSTCSAGLCCDAQVNQGSSTCIAPGASCTAGEQCTNGKCS